MKWLIALLLLPTLLFGQAFEVDSLKAKKVDSDTVKGAVFQGLPPVDLSPFVLWSDTPKYIKWEDTTGNGNTMSRAQIVALVAGGGMDTSLFVFNNDTLSWLPTWLRLLDALNDTAVERANDYALLGHNHSGVYATLSHNHSGVYLPVTDSANYQKTNDTLDYDATKAWTLAQIAGIPSVDTSLMVMNADSNAWLPTWADVNAKGYWVQVAGVYLPIADSANYAKLADTTDWLPTWADILAVLGGYSTTGHNHNGTYLPVADSANYQMNNDTLAWDATKTWSNATFSLTGHGHAGTYASLADSALYAMREDTADWLPTWADILGKGYWVQAAGVYAPVADSSLYVMTADTNDWLPSWNDVLAQAYYNSGDNASFGTVTGTGLGTFGDAAATSVQLIVKGGASGADLLQLQRTTGATLTYGWSLAGNKLSFNNVTSGKTTLQTSWGVSAFPSSSTAELNVGFDYGASTESNGDPGLIKGSNAGGAQLDGSGGDLYIAPGKGTGEATPARLHFGFTTATFSGTTLQTLSVKATMAGGAFTEYDDATPGAGKILRGDGTKLTYSTMTYPNTIAANSLLYGSASNTLSELTTTATRVMITDGAGLPQWSNNLPTGTTIGAAYIYRAAGTDVSLADGGTNSSLTASNGGVVYSDATSLQILAGTATANKVLMSGATAAPSWSTPTYPNATATLGRQIVGDGTNFVMAKRDTFASLTSDFTMTSTTSTYVTGLSCYMLANEVWHFEAYLRDTLSGATGGVKVAIDVPTSAVLWASCEGATTAAGTYATEFMIADNTLTTTNWASAAGYSSQNRIVGHVRNGANAGSVAIMIARPGASGTATARAGSFFRAWRLN